MRAHGEPGKELTDMVSANIPNSTRKQVYARDGYVCALCGCHDTLQIHHAIPRKDGGSDFPDNLITLCSKCHAQVHGIDVYPGVMTREDVEQAVVEYLSDMYTTVGPDGQNESWYPFK